MLRAVAESRGEARTLLEMAPRGDSRGNGHAERAVRTVEENVRLQLAAFEQRTNIKMSVTDRMFAWVVEYAVDI